MSISRAAAAGMVRYNNGHGHGNLALVTKVQWRMRRKGHQWCPKKLLRSHKRCFLRNNGSKLEEVETPSVGNKLKCLKTLGNVD